MYQTSPDTGGRSQTILQRQAVDGAHNVLHCWLTARLRRCAAHGHQDLVLTVTFILLLTLSSTAATTFQSIGILCNDCLTDSMRDILFCNSAVVVVCVCHFAAPSSSASFIQIFKEACAYTVLSSKASYNTEIKQEFSYRRDEHSAPGG